MRRPGKISNLLGCGGLVVTAWVLPGVALLAQTTAQQPEASLPDGSLKISLSSRFRKLDGADRYTSLETMLPAALKIALLPQRWMDVSVETQSNAVAQNREPIESRKSDYTIDGSFLEVQDRIILAVNIRAVVDGSIVSVESARLSGDSLLSGIDVLANKLVNRLKARALAAQDRQPILFTIAAPFTTEIRAAGGAAPAENLASIAKWLPEALIGYLGKTKPGNVTFQLGDSPTRGDAVIGGKVAQVGNRVVISITLSEKNPVLTFSTSVPRESVSGAPDLMARQLQQIIRARTTPQGEWRMETVSFSSTDADEFMRQAREYRGDGQLARAALMYRKAIEVKPDVAEPRFALADIFQLQSDGDAAAAEYEELLRRDPRNGFAEEGLGSISLHRGDLEAAIRHFSTAVENTPSDVHCHLYSELGDTYVLTGNADAAIASYRKAIQADPKDDVAYRALSRAFLGAGKTAEAELVLTEGIASATSGSQLKQDMVQIYRRQAQDRIVQRDYAGAELVLRKMLAVGAPANAVGVGGYQAVVTAFHELGRDQDAVALLQAELERNPSNPDLLAFLAGLYHDNLNEYEKGFQANQARFAVLPNDVDSMADLAESCLTTNRLDQALSLANNVLAASDNTIEVRLSARLITIAALLLQKRPADAYAEVGQFIGYYTSLPSDYDRHWTFRGTKHFITQQNMSDSDRQTILSLIGILESPKAEAAKQVKALAATLPSRFEQHPAK